MSRNNSNRLESTKLKNEEIILPAYTYLPKICFNPNKDLDCPPEYIADMLRDLAEAILTSYPKFKENSSEL